MPENAHANDPVGVASARMYARGIAGADRLEALKLLGVLIDHADHAGRVSFDADVLAAELAAGINQAHRYYRWLESTGVIQREGDGWQIVGYTPPTGAMSTADAMDVVARVMARDDRSPTAATPAAAGTAPVVPITAASRRRAVPALAGVGAAAVIAWVVALVATSVGPTATEIAISQPLAQAATREPGRIVTAAPQPVSESAATVANAPGSASAVATGKGSGPSGAVAACAPSRPRLRIDRVDVVSADKADDGDGLGSGWVILVSGTIENPGAAPIEMRAFDIDVTHGSQSLTTSGLQAPLLLPAFTASPWSTLLYAGRHEPQSPKAQAALRDWSHTGLADC